MNVTIQTINPNFIEHEGFYFLEFNGEYFKGCKRCGGEGHYQHNGDHSRCYACDNTSAKLGEPLESREAAEKWCHVRALAKANRERKAEAKRMIEVNALAAKVAALPADVVEFLLAIDTEDERDSFVCSMAEQVQYVTNARRPFTEKMIEAVRSSIAKRAAKVAEAEAHPAPSGRVIVTGEIVGAKVVEGDYGTAYKVTVKDDQGFRVYVSLAKGLVDEAYGEFLNSLKDDENLYTFGPNVWFQGTEGRWAGVKGRRVTFTATLEQSHDDKSFAFGSRPTKGTWLA